MSALDSVTIGGQAVGPVRSVRAASREGSELDDAEIDLVDSSANRQPQPGDEVLIQWNSGPSWTGEVVGRPSTSNGILTYRALGESIPLKHEQVYRVFYEQTSADAVRALVTEQAEQLPLTEVHSGDTPSDWSSVAPVAEPYAGGRAGLYNFGTDLLFVGCRSGHSSELRATYQDVGTREIADGIYRLETRVISPLPAEWEFIVELKTPSGTSYRWEPDLRRGPHTYELLAEEAEPEDSGLNDGELRYRWIPRGQVATNTGFLIDNAATVPFRTSARNAGIDAAGVEDTGRTITRRVDGSAGEAISDLAVSDDASVWVENNSLQYVPGTEATDAAATIEAGTTPVVNVQADRDFESIRNEIFVQGSDGTEAIARDKASIRDYGRQRPESVADPQLTSDDAADARAEGELDDAAFDDASITFNVADITAAGLTAGQRIKVEWPPENLSGRYPISGVAVRSDGIVSVTITASTVQ